MSNYAKIAVSILALLTLTACKQEQHVTSIKQESIAAPTLTVQVEDLPFGTVVPGMVFADRRIDISSRVVGLIETLDLRAGQTVNKDDLLVHIDSDDIEEAIRQAKAALMQAEEKLTDATIDLDKFERLAKKGSVSTESLRKANVNKTIAEAARSQAAAVLSSAEAQRKYAEIRSPVKGVVVNVNRHSGEIAMTGTPIMTIESRELLLFKIYVAEGTLPHISEKEEIEVRIDAMKEQVFKGFVRGIVPSSDSRTHRYEVDIALPASDALVPGMFGRAVVSQGARQVPIIPKSAIVKRAGLRGVFVVNDDQTSSFRWLRTGQEWDEKTEIVAGLKAGERIILEPAENLRDGTIILATAQ